MPSFKYACFISYRHGQQEVKERFVKEFHKTLSGELGLLRKETVCVDWDRLRGGDFYNASLARAVCESACFIAIYHPTYFDLEHTYCAREYRAMCQLESNRLQLLPTEDRDHGLIVPVILRGEDSIPTEIAAKRHFEDFSSFMLLDVELSRHPNYAQKIRQIAGYIDARCKSFLKAGVDFDCATLKSIAAEHPELPGTNPIRRRIALR